MKNFKSINEIRYEDWIEYKKVEDQKNLKNETAHTGLAAGLFALSGIGSVIGAIFTGGIGTIILAIIASLFFSASITGLVICFAPISDVDYPSPTDKNEKREIKKEQARVNRFYKYLKRTRQWKQFDKIMREYQLSSKFKADRAEYEKAQQQKAQPSVETTEKVVDTKPTTTIDESYVEDQYNDGTTV